MSLFQLNYDEILSFFAVFVRYGVLVAVLPFIGDRFVPASAKILFSLAVSVALFPFLVARGQISPSEASIWGASAGGIVVTIGLEALFGLVLGYTARLTFDAISFGANLAGNFMGFATASTYDPHQETQTHVVAELQMVIAMLIFLAVDGHHLMLRSSFDSYGTVGLGQAGLTTVLSQRLVDISGQVIRFGVQLAAPMAVALFSVNLIFGIFAKAMPQLNVLVLSLAVSSLVGLFVLFISIGSFQAVCVDIIERGSDWMEVVKLALVGK